MSQPGNKGWSSNVAGYGQALRLILDEHFPGVTALRWIVMQTFVGRWHEVSKAAGYGPTATHERFPQLITAEEIWSAFKDLTLKDVPPSTVTIFVPDRRISRCVIASIRAGSPDLGTVKDEEPITRLMETGIDGAGRFTAEFTEEVRWNPS